MVNGVLTRPTALEYYYSPMVHVTPVTGSMTCKMVRVLKTGLMEANSSAPTSREIRMGTESSVGQMATIIVASLLLTTYLGKASIDGTTVATTQAPGWRTKCMGMGS